MSEQFKEFKPSSWAIDNKVTIYLITIFLTIAGIMAYKALPKENFPDITVPTIFISTVNGGNSPTNIENTITRPIEKRLKAISGVKKFTSTSMQDLSVVVVEFHTDIDVSVAKQKVKDAVDEARGDMPATLTREPMIKEIAFSEIPIMYINVAGNYSLSQLKKYADDLSDRIEGLSEINEVQIVGALEREIQVNIDVYKLQAAQLTIGDIQRAIGSENLTITGGNVPINGMKPTLSIKSEFKNPKEIENIIVTSQSGAQLFIKDIATVVDGFKEQESYSSSNGKNVITLNIIKRSGENLIEASEKIQKIITEMKTEEFPDGLDLTVSGDQSQQTKTMLHDLINTIIIGFILVTLVLMFFMGITNALFVALSVPLSMFIAFLVMPSIDFSFNMIVLFSFILALGIVVDDAIVVIENTHRIYANGKVPIVKAAKKAAGEVFLPVLSGTLTTLAPFVPLAFWKGVVGKFMFFLPVTLIITLLASLLVAYIMNPVFAVDFMKPHDHGNQKKSKITRGYKITAAVFGILALLFYVTGYFGMGNFTVTLFAIYSLHRFWLEDVIEKFQTKAWPSFQNAYQRLLVKVLKGRRPVYMLLGTLGLLFVSIFAIIIAKPGVVFFPQAEPNFTYVYLTLPVGTNASYTDSITKIAEKKVFEVIGEKNSLVESVISNVAVGATDPNSGDRTTASNKAKITVAFVEFSKRDGKSTREMLEKIRKSMTGFPGVEIIVEPESNGPPVGKVVNIEIRGDEFESLTATASGLKRYLDEQKIPGVEELKSDFVSSKPEIAIVVDRERANREGISTAQIGMALRNSIYGAEASKFKDEADDYPIMVRVRKDQVNNLDELLNMRITFRDMVMGGMLRSVPLSAVASVEYTNSYGGINRLNQKRVITLSSNALPGFAPNEVVASVKAAINEYEKPSGVEIVMTGEQEQQAETAGFLGTAMLASIGLIIIILVTQFNSISKPIIILSEIIFSVIGVLLGIAIFGMNFSVVMTGIGIVALAGIVVRNGILLVEFTELLREEGVPLYDAIIEAGRTRMTPVLLTASAAILGLIPLAVGLNIDFVTMFTELNPHIFFGGDSVAFWGPLSWTMIFGLSFSTFLTLLLVPAMYLLNEKLKVRVFGWFGRKYDPDANVKPNALQNMDY